MIAQEDLQAAVTEGIIDQAQAVRIAHLARLRQAALPATEATSVDPDDERFRLIGGFNDVFVAIGICLLTGALFGLSRVLGFSNAFSAVAIFAAWGLSEIFAKRMRLALPSILLALMFAGAAAFLAGSVSGPHHLSLGQHKVVVGYGTHAVFLAFGLAATLHSWRFRVPINGALFAIGLAGLVLATFLTVFPRFTDRNFDLLLLVAGGLVFSFALKFDMRDPGRLTRRSDIAFWLHLLAAGLIVHPIFRNLVGTNFGTGQAMAILSVFVALGVVALVIDRRALLVSALSYAGIAVAFLISQNVSANLSLPLTLLGLAILVLSLSAGWRRLRGAVLPRLPLGSLRDRLPPIELQPA